MTTVSGVRRQRLTLGGFETSLLSAGDPDAPLLLLLHDGAWGASAEASWGRALPVFADCYHVLAPDLYGYGQSSKVVQFDVAPYEFRLRQIAALLDALGFEDRPAHVIGNSFSGGMALRGAVLPWFCWRMRSATSIAGTGGPYRTVRSLEALGRFDGTHADMRRIVTLLTGEFEGIDEQVDQRMATASAPGHYRAVASVAVHTPFSAARGNDPYPASLGEARIPLAFVSGEDDDLVEPEWATEISRYAPHAAAYTVAGRHSPNVSHPERTARFLLEVLAANEAVAEEGQTGSPSAPDAV